MRVSKPMDGLIQVRVARDEKLRLIEMARNRGLTLSQLFRQGAEALARQSASSAPFKTMGGG